MSVTQYEPASERRKKETYPEFSLGVQLQGNYHQAPLHLCTNNLTAAAIDTVHAEIRLTPGPAVPHRK